MFNLKVKNTFNTTSNKNFNRLTVTNTVIYDDKKHTEISNLKFRKWLYNDNYYVDFFDIVEKRLNKGGLL